VVNLLHDGETLTALEPLHDPELPQGPLAVQLLGEDPAREPLELAQVPGPGNSRVSHVVGDVEVRIVDPDGMLPDRDPPESLAIPRQKVETRADVAPNALDVDSTAGGPEGTRAKHDRRRDVHVLARTLEVQKGGVLGAQSLIARIGHLPLSGPSAGLQHPIIRRRRIS
jgi:hypothetical protein